MIFGAERDICRPSSTEGFEIRMEEELDTWIEAALELIRSTSEDLKTAYSGPGLEHCRRVASALHCRFGDLPLTRAAFLHRVQPEDFQPALTELAGAQALSILRSRATLRALDDFNDQKLPERLEGSLLPGFADPRAAVLLVLEQLDHVDPTGALAAWTLQAYDSIPSELPRCGPASLDCTRFQNPAAQANFLRCVVEPTARFFGLHLERRTAANAELLCRDLARFSELLELLRAGSAPGGGKDQVLDQLRAALPDREIRWEWVALGQLDRLLTSEERLGPQDFPETGVALVLVDSSEQAFSVLSRLHETFSYSRAAVTDDLSRPTRERGALTTQVTLQGPWLEAGRPREQRRIRVEIARRAAVATRRLPGDLLAEGRRTDSSRQAQDLDAGFRVLTPHGLHVVLPRGATVLNFAYAVHNDFVGLARRARVNRRYVGLFHPLSEGDVVWLEVGEVPQALPNAWRERVAPGSVAKILKQYKRVLKPVLRQAGERTLRQKLTAAGCRLEEFENRLSEFAIRAGLNLTEKGVIPRVAGQSQGRADWWCQQLAILEHSERGEELPFELILNRTTASAFLEELVGAVLSTARVELETLQVPLEMRRLVGHARRCLRCRPRLAGSLLGEVVEGDLVLHRLGSACPPGELTFVVHGPPTSGAFYCLRTLNRTGLAADLFRIFADVGAEVVDIAAARVAARAGIFRIELEHLPAEMARGLDAQLKRVPGVLTVERPGSAKIPEEMLGGVLPPRRLHSGEQGIREPFFCGDKILDDGFFYGMRDQKATLSNLLHGVTENPQVATSVWIRGPKKVGKSSLVLSFMRELVRRGDGDAVYIEAERGESWPSLAARLTAKLAPDMAPNLTVADAVRLRQAQKPAPLVVVIDEAVNLIMNTVKDGGLELLLRSRSQLNACQGLLLVWVGPNANVPTLPPPAKHLLQSSAMMSVPPLEEEDVESMLTCQRLPFPCIVSAEKGLSALVRHLTGGNPFWIAHLGRAMWERTRRRGGDPAAHVHFDTQLFREAVRDVCAEETPFQDRFESEHWDPSTKALARRLLLVLADRASRRLRAPRMNGSSTDELLVALGPGVNSSHVGALLEDLTWRGAVASEASERGRLWRLSAPILADHLAPPDWFNDL
jgi:hypothetical protein